MANELSDYAAVQDVATTLGRAESSLKPEQESQIQDWIWKTQRIIQRKLGNLAALNEYDLKDVISEVVARRFLNPTGKQYERIDDYGYGLDKDTAKATLYLTEDEWDQLTPQIIDREVGCVQLPAHAGYGPSATSASDHPVRGWWA